MKQNENKKREKKKKKINFNPIIQKNKMADISRKDKVSKQTKVL